jgi:hypothetical protein
VLWLKACGYPDNLKAKKFPISGGMGIPNLAPKVLEECIILCLHLSDHHKPTAQLAVHNFTNYQGYSNSHFELMNMI